MRSNNCGDARQDHCFYTALALLNNKTGICRPKWRKPRHRDPAMRRLRALAQEQPYHCAGSAKSEGWASLMHDRR
jgi:hypothetical protein